MQKIIIILSATLLLTSCSYLRPYHPPVQQGNDLSSAAVSQLKVGMAREEVLNILGEPVISDIFANNNRLLYVYYFAPTKGTTVKKCLNLRLQANKLQTIEHSC